MCPGSRRCSSRREGCPAVDEAPNGNMLRSSATSERSDRLIFRCEAPVPWPADPCIGGIPGQERKNWEIDIKYHEQIGSMGPASYTGASSSSSSSRAGGVGGELRDQYKDFNIDKRGQVKSASSGQPIGRAAADVYKNTREVPPKSIACSAYSAGTSLKGGESYGIMYDLNYKYCASDREKTLLTHFLLALHIETAVGGNNLVELLPSLAACLCCTAVGVPAYVNM